MLYIKKNVAVNPKILRYIFAKPKGLPFEKSYQFQEQANCPMKKWDDLEAMKHHSTSQFSLYVKKHYLDNPRNKPASYGMQQFDLGKDPYCQNIPESVNFKIKGWVNFLPCEINRFLISLQDLVFLFQTEDEFARFGFSDKRGVKDEFK